MGRQEGNGQAGSQQERESPQLARAQLANERTFLSWARTATTSLALGLVAAQLLPLGKPRAAALAEAIGALLIVAGIFEAIAGLYRYYLNLRESQAQRFQPATTSAEVTIILTVMAAVLSLALILLL